MFINYLTLMLVNLVAGLLMAAYFFLRGDDIVEHRRWAPGFAIVGLVGVLTGVHMIYTWPLPGPHNIAFGEMEFLFGIIFLGAALAAWLGAGYAAVSVFSLVAGIAAIVVGSSIISIPLTRSPIVSGAGFILAGLTGVLFPVVAALWTNRALRLVVAIIALVAAVIFALTGYPAYPSHFDQFRNYAPPTIQQTQQGG